MGIMDWQTKIGLGVAIAFGILPFVVKDMPQWLTWPGLSFGVLLALWGLLPNHDKIPYGPAFLFITCTSGIAASVAWFYTTAASAISTLDNKISFNCYSSPRPTHAREDKLLHMLQIIEPYQGKLLPASAGYTFMPPGNTEIKWGEGTSPEWGSRCVLTNYSEVPFFQVSVPLTIVWREVVKIENGTTAGKTIAEVTIKSPPLDIGAGVHNEDYFYIMNYSLYWVSIILPDSAGLHRAGSSNVETAKLIPPNMFAAFDIALQPNPYRKPPPTNPPAASPPTPAPSGTPKKK
jgi:hypothetical protein